MKGMAKQNGGGSKRVETLNQFEGPEVGSINYIVYCTWTKLWLRFSVVAVGLARFCFFTYSTWRRVQRSELRKTFWIGCSWSFV